MSHVHLIGIGGTGLSAIARILLESGYTVSGSDMRYSQLAKAVESAGAKIYLGHRPENLRGADIVVRSSAVPEDNLEVKIALRLGIPVLKRSEFIGKLMKGKRTIAVAGTHGKTTTTAMIAWGLTQLDQDPSFILGGVISRLETNAKSGKGDTFVVEADEYDRMFLGLNPDIAVVTNIEHDHPDCFPTKEEYTDAFRQFVSHLPANGILISCGDDQETSELLAIDDLKGKKHLTYGIENPENEMRALDVNPNPLRGGFEFSVAPNDQVIHIALQVPGIHNVLNALAALTVFDQLGLSLEASARTLEKFQGTGRRFELVGEAGGVTVISDYAHHPTEIKATLSAAKTRYPGREIWAVWQPHTYSRTKLLLSEFINSFSDALHVLILEIYSAREPLDKSFSGRQIVDAMRHPDVQFASDVNKAVGMLSSQLKAFDVLIVLAAGDADQICARVLANIREYSEVEK
jgi:UDP-N-acetylmuramate--alanine ligase